MPPGLLDSQAAVKAGTKTLACFDPDGRQTLPGLFITLPGALVGQNTCVPAGGEGRGFAGVIAVSHQLPVTQTRYHPGGPGLVR